MEPVRERRTLDEVGRKLLGPLLRLETESPAGWKLAGWDAEHGLSVTLTRGETCLLIEAEPRDESRECYARTARFNVCARPSFRGNDLTESERKAVDQVVEVLRRQERLLPEFERPPSSRRAEVREIEVERLLTPEGQGHYYINPYVGCTIGCEFCYVAKRADLSRAFEGLPTLPWGRFVDVKVNAAAVLRDEIHRFLPGVVRFSPVVTDPYQPLERRYRITRQCLEVLRETKFVPVILTRAARVLEDLDLLASFPRAAVGMSIPTDDEHIRQLFEPGADPIDERFDALQKLHERGIKTFAVIQPMLPMNPERLVSRMAPFVTAVRIDRMYELDKSRSLYEEAGRLDALEDGFFEKTGKILREGFAAHGVALDGLDDLGKALGLL